VLCGILIAPRSARSGRAAMHPTALLAADRRGKTRPPRAGFCSAARAGQHGTGISPVLLASHAFSICTREIGTGFSRLTRGLGVRSASVVTGNGSRRRVWPAVVAVVYDVAAADDSLTILYKILNHDTWLAGIAGVFHGSPLREVVFSICPKNATNDSRSLKPKFCITRGFSRRE